MSHQLLIEDQHSSHIKSGINLLRNNNLHVLILSFGKHESLWKEILPWLQTLSFDMRRNSHLELVLRTLPEDSELCKKLEDTILKMICPKVDRLQIFLSRDWEPYTESLWYWEERFPKLCNLGIMSLASAEYLQGLVGFIDHIIFLFWLMTRFAAVTGV